MSLFYKIKKTFEIIRKKWLKEVISAIYYYFTTNIKNIRKELLHKYIQWNGIEIWGLDNLAPINRTTTQVKYVDYLNEENLKKNYTDLKIEQLQKIDYICKADDLDKIEADSQDFVIANHLFEHLENPIRALLERYRVVKNGWKVFMAIPDKRKTSDEYRKRTTLEHIVIDFTNRSEERDWEHYLEYAWINFSDWNQIEAEAKRLKSTNYSIHYHVFIEEDVLAIIERCDKNTHAKFDIIHVKHTTKNPADNEFIIILNVVK